MGRERGKGEQGCSRFDPPPSGRLLAAFACSSGGSPPRPLGRLAGRLGFTGLGGFGACAIMPKSGASGPRLRLAPKRLVFCLPEDRRARGGAAGSFDLFWLVLACFGLLLVFFLNSIRRPRAPGGGGFALWGGRSAVFPLGSGAAWGEGPAQIGRAARLGRTLISGGRRGFAGFDFVFIFIFISICNCFLQSFFLFSFFFGLFFY